MLKDVLEPSIHAEGMRRVSVHIVTLGCARNEVDSEELAARLDAQECILVDDPALADVVIVNTCGFIEQAKKDSIDTVLAAAETKSGRGHREKSGGAAGDSDAGGSPTPKVIAVGCLAQRYGTELAEALPEADAVLGFDDYPDIADKVRTVLAGGKISPPTPGDRRQLLPLTPVSRPASAQGLSVPGHSQDVRLDPMFASPTAQPAAPALSAPLAGSSLSSSASAVTNTPLPGAPASGPRILRTRLGKEPYAPLKIASGCDRRCAFCAIPGFRGAYLSRPMDDIVAEAEWLVAQGVREIMLVSENSSSYGKDFSDPDALPQLLKRLNGIDDLGWIRVSYLQPAEIRPGLVSTMIDLDHVVNYFDLSFQHASATVLRRMRRFGDPDSFLDLIGSIRSQAPQSGIRTNVIVGFPGETEDDVETLAQFLIDAQLDIVGVFAYSDEDGTEAASLDAHIDEDEILARRDYISTVVDELCNQRAEDRIGEHGTMMIETIGSEIVGRMEHQGAEVDGICTLVGGVDHLREDSPRPGDFVPVTIVGSDGVDIFVESRTG